MNDQRRPTLCVVAGPNGSRYFKSLENASEAVKFVDRAYIYDNSVNDQLPKLLFRMTDGKVFKQYTNDIPDWAKLLMNE